MEERAVGDDGNRTGKAAVHEPAKLVIGAESPTWEEFLERLTRVLGKMAVDTFLIISAKGPEPDTEYFVQFAQGGRSGFLAEAVSNKYLSGTSALSPTQDEQMGDLGWMSPTPGSTVEPNYSRQWPMPVPYDEAARLAIRTLREVHGVVATSQLSYKCFARGGHEFAQAANFSKVDRDDITGAIPNSGPGCTGAGCNDFVAIVCTR